MSLTVAKTILEQLGGGRFVVMTGAKNFIGDETGVTFRIPGSGGFAKNGINVVRITLDPFDTYIVTFSRLRGSKLTTVETYTDIYAENLQFVFTEATGLRTHLITGDRPCNTLQSSTSMEDGLSWV